MKEKYNKLPLAKKRDHFMTIHGDTRNDPYFWMRLTDAQKNAETPDEQTLEVSAYLNAENDFLEDQMAPVKTLREDIYKEMVGRIKQEDQSVPYKENGYYYISKFEKGKEFPVYTRKKDTLENEEHLLLDVNSLAEKHNYYQIGGISVSPDNLLMAFGEDTKSRRQYKIRFKNISTGEFLEDEIENTNGSAVWAHDNKTLFYSVKDKSLRSYKIFRHILGETSDKDVMVYHEKDEAFHTYVYKSKSKKYIIIGSGSTTSNEYRFLKSDDPYSNPELFQERTKKLEYSIAHFEDRWYIRTNKEAENFKIMSCPENETGLSSWKDFLAHKEDVLIEGMDIFKDYFVVNERIDGTTQLRVIPNSGETHYIELPESSHFVYSGKNPEYDTAILRFNYTSMVTPNSVYDYNMSTREMTLMKRQTVLGDFDLNNYKSERLDVEASDGKKIPLSLVYRKNTKLDGKAPLLLYGYGSYGISMDPYFSSIRLSLLDRGFVFATAHIRGGEELGRKWYNDGRLMNKKNTFNDFISCGEYVIANKYCSVDKLFAMGGSAGGLLMGAVMNMKPDLWRGIIAAVPFVDVVTTMLDESIPLTTGEFEEWGNPKEEEFYNYIKSYSPYDNIEPKDYPALLVTTGYHDSQVQYWEPVKWVAKLRDLKSDQNPLLMHCDMETGHGGASGRFKRLKDTALEYAFLLWILGHKD